MKFCFASNNENKLAEVRALLQGHEVVSLKEAGCFRDLAEEQDTLEGNSAQKAQFVFDLCGVSCFADDTGLETEALNGEPGVYSARYAGLPCSDEKNRLLLLKNMEDKENRRARFRTVITLITPEVTQQFEGLLEGTIARSQRGINGFGYDSVFIPEGKNSTMAEMSADDKNRISHRAMAVKKMAAYIRAEFGEKKREKSEDKLTMKDWSPADQPREKMLLKGARELSDAELLAVLFRAGTRTMNAVELAKALLAKAGNDLMQLERMSLKEMQQIKGIGMVKATAIGAALELGRRQRVTIVREPGAILHSRKAFEAIAGDLLNLPQEEFWIIILNQAKKIIGKKRISQGGIASTGADPRLIFRHAVNEGGTAVILAHNHPSGSLEPSETDIKLTNKLKAAGEILNIQVCDHLIVAGQSYYSFSDEGLL